MRTFWTSVVLVAVALVLVGPRAEAGRRVAEKKQPAAPPGEPKAAVVTGYGETKPAARASALREAQDWLEEELRDQLRPEQMLPRKSLDEAYLRAKGALEEELKEPVADANAAWAMKYKVTLTQDFVRSALKDARDEWVSYESQARKEGAAARQRLMLTALGGALAVLLVVTGYLRLEEATRGYYTALLRVGAVGLLLLAALALVMLS